MIMKSNAPLGLAAVVLACTVLLMTTIVVIFLAVNPQ